MHSMIKTLLLLTLPLWLTNTLAAELYFPESVEQWQTVSPASVGWDSGLLDAALELAGERDSSGVLILHNGLIMAERNWDSSEFSPTYQNLLTGADAQGRAIEDVASAQKSLLAILTGMAQERGYLSIDDSVTQYLGEGWSKASAQQERVISIRHLLSMNSGLATDFSFVASPNTQWLYNTPVYHVLMRVLTAATQLDRHELTSQWITEPIGMVNSSWTPRPWASADIAVGFSTTTRELAMLGLMLQGGGRWQENVVLEDSGYIEAMLSPSQTLNPAYGYLWWLNGQGFSRDFSARAGRREGALIASAPADLVTMQGGLDRKLYLVPSLNIIVTRLGAAGQADGETFNDAFWRALMRAAPSL